MVSERNHITEALERLGSQVDRMEVFGARSEGPTAASLKDLEESDLFVGIYAYRYGTIPTDALTSITEQEYDYAKKLGKPMFCFTIKEYFLVKSFSERFTIIFQLKHCLRKKYQELVVLGM